MRTLSLISLLAVLAVGGYLLNAQWRTAGPTSRAGSTAAAAAGTEVAALNLQAAALALEQHRTAAGAYTGAQLSGLGVALRRADTGSYCVETVRAPIVHLAGPGATAASGPC